MKRFALILICLLAIGIQVEGQYRKDRKLYDPKTYERQKGDRYSVLGTRVGSAIIPGLGQAICGEPLRGGLFLVGNLGCWSIATIGFFGLGYTPSTGPAALFVSGLAGALTTYIWSIVDAGRVAKVKNLAYRARKDASLEWRVNPTVIPSAMPGRVAPGLTLQMHWPVR